MKCNFVVGQRVVCIETWCDIPGVPVLPVRGGIYKIRNIIARAEDIGLMFSELINPSQAWRDGYGEAAFNVEYFRPLQDRPRETDTDIGIFNQILVDASLYPEMTPEKVE